MPLACSSGRAALLFIGCGAAVYQSAGGSYQIKTTHSNPPTGEIIKVKTRARKTVGARFRPLGEPMMSLRLGKPFRVAAVGELEAPRSAGQRCGD